MINHIFKNYRLWIYPSTVFGIHLVATAGGIYYRYLWFDSPMHLFGGAAIGISTYYFFKLTAPKLQWWIVAILIISMTALVAVGWEWIEFSLDVALHSHNQPGLSDTMKDLYFGIVGATVVSLVTIKKSEFYNLS